MSPARRVPSHGTDLFGITYAIDFVGVDESGLSAPVTWRSRLWSEPPDTFTGFGRPILAPVAGTVVVAHDGEDDHVGRRSSVTLIPYLLGQAGRVRQGIDAVAGNHVVVAIAPEGPFVGLVHLRQKSVTVTVGQVVSTGDQLGQCGNSGNSTEPCVHLQVTDSTSWQSARGLPLAFRAYRRGDGVIVREGLPGEGEVIQAV